MAYSSAWLVAPPPPSPGAISTAAAPASKTSTGPDVVVGVDTHKHSHMSVALSANGGWLGRLKLDAQHRDFQDLIAAEPMAPGSVYTTSVTGDGMVGLYRLEVSISAGNGKLKPAGGVRRRLGRRPPT